MLTCCELDPDWKIQTKEDPGWKGSKLEQDPERVWGSANRTVVEISQYLEGAESQWYGSPSYLVTKFWPETGTG